MIGSLGINVSGTLPAKVRFADTPPQRARTEPDALTAKVGSQQRHCPTVGIVPEISRIALQQSTQTPLGELAPRTRSAAAGELRGKLAFMCVHAPTTLQRVGMLHNFWLPT